MSDIEVIASKEHPLGGFFLALTQERTFLVGRTALSANVFSNAQRAYDAHRAAADAGSHWAWNICYELEPFL